LNISITNGRNKQCKDAIGGVKSVYLAPYKKVTRSNIIYDGVELNGFPQTFIYQFKMTGGVSFTQTQQDSDGGKSFTQSITLNFSKLSVFDNLNFTKLLRKDYFIVVEDYNGNILLLGATNGTMSNCTKATGASGNDLSGYTLTITAEEGNLSPFLDGAMKTALKALVSDVVVS